MRRKSRARRWIDEPRPSIPHPRPHLLAGVLAFVRAAKECEGVRRMALVGSLATEKPIPKDADVLVTVAEPFDLENLARLGRRLKGTANHINLGADVFLADETGAYLGRICPYRECHFRMRCHALHCGARQHLNDDFEVLTLQRELIASPPVELWPTVVRRAPVPTDVEQALLATLESDARASQ